MPAPDFALAVFKGLSHVAPHAHILRLKNEDFSRDPEVVDAMNADPLIAHETQPTKTVAEMVRADERLEEGVPADHASAADPARHSGQGHEAERERVLLRRTTGSRDKTLKLYEGHYHDLLNDVGKETVMADIRNGSTCAWGGRWHEQAENLRI